MEKVNVPYKIAQQIATYEGEWTAEEIDAGLATLKRIEVSEAWYEPSPQGPIRVSDPERIAELEASISE